MKSIVAAATLCLALAVGPAMADEDGRFYAGAGIGEWHMKVEGFDNGSLDDSDLAYQIFGGIRVTPYFAVELYYSKYGKVRDDIVSLGDEVDLTLELSDYGPYLVGVLPLGRFQLYAKLGYLFHSSNLKAVFNDGTIQTDQGDSEDAVYAAGVGMVVLDGLELRLGYEVLDIPIFNEPDVIWLTGAWRF
jgi:hypothetical protein